MILYRLGMTFLEWLNFFWLSVFFPGAARTLEWRMLRVLNKERRIRGLRILRMQPDLRFVARGHSRDMARKDFFSHRNQKGQKAADRLRLAGITDVSSGENLAKVGGFDAPVETAHIGLMKSKGHRKNILSRKYNCVGIGAVKSKTGIFYFTQVFAYRELIFSGKIPRKARMRSGLLLKGRSFVKEAQLLYYLKNVDDSSLILEGVVEITAKSFVFRLFVDEPGIYNVAIFYSSTGRGQFCLVNEFDVKFMNKFRNLECTLKDKRRV